MQRLRPTRFDSPKARCSSLLVPPRFRPLSASIASVGYVLCIKSGNDCNWPHQIDQLTRKRKSLLLLRHRIDQVNCTGLTVRALPNWTDQFLGRSDAKLERHFQKDRNAYRGYDRRTRRSATALPARTFVSLQSQPNDGPRSAAGCSRLPANSARRPDAG